MRTSFKKIQVAGQEGLEPTTIGFGIRRSTVGATDLLIFFEKKRQNVWYIKNNSYLCSVNKKQELLKLKHHAEIGAEND